MEVSSMKVSLGLRILLNLCMSAAFLRDGMLELGSPGHRWCCGNTLTLAVAITRHSSGALTSSGGLSLHHLHVEEA